MYRNHSFKGWRFVPAILLAAMSVAEVELSGAGCALRTARPARAEDLVRRLQERAIEERTCDWGYWGMVPGQYSTWTTHSNRLVPLYVYGMTLDCVRAERAVYRDAARIEALYGRVPRETHNPSAPYLDNTDLFRLQEAAVAAGKRYIFLVIFDGLDWQTLRAGAIVKAGRVTYDEGSGSGLHLQDYRESGLTTSDFGFYVTSPHNDGTTSNVDRQEVNNPGGIVGGGYSAAHGGATPWGEADATYLAGLRSDVFHAVTDSASGATALTCGQKSYNDAINVDGQGRQLEPIALRLQREGWAIGVVTSVPISHATPACAYAHNVHRDDYQDLTRDMVGLPSISHPHRPLLGVDVLAGCGWGETVEKDEGQGANFVPGNRYLTESDRQQLSLSHGGEWIVVERQSGVSGKASLDEAAVKAIAAEARLFAYYGVKGGHLPFRTADGGYDPVQGVKSEEKYEPADVAENPTLAELTAASLAVLEHRRDRFWMMVEAGDVDWANHDNNIDNSIGAVISGDEAVKTITDWIERHDAWEHSVVILGADHGHLLHLTRPAALVGGN